VALFAWDNPHRIVGAICLRVKRRRRTSPGEPLVAIVPVRENELAPRIHIQRAHFGQNQNGQSRPGPTAVRMTDRDKTNTEIITGPAGSGKTELLLARHRAALTTGEIGCALWIAPTHRSAAEVRARVLSGGFRGCLQPGVMTFSQFAEQILSASSTEVQPITSLVKRQIIRRLILSRAAGDRLKHFGPIAGTSGLTDLVCELISELKTQEIWPEEFQTACETRGMGPKDRDLLALYSDYQVHLNHRGLYDAEGRFWIARELLRGGARRPFEALKSVIVDGFADFTRPQHEILQILSQRAESMAISLPLEAGAARTDLFAKPAQTLGLLKKHQPSLSVQAIPRRERADWPTLGHVEGELFKSPRHVKPAATIARIEIIEAARAIDELSLVGRRVKQLLLAGDPDNGRPVAPSDITVVLRSPAAVASLVAEVFDDLGLPYLLADGRALSQAPALAALVNLVRLHVDDWPYRELTTLLAHNYFQPDWPQWRQGQAWSTADGVIRGLQVPYGRAALLAAVERDAQSTDPKTSAAAKTTLKLLERLSEAFDRLPTEATSAEWADTIATLGAETGVYRAITLDPESLATTNAAAWDLLIQSLASAERFATPKDGKPDHYDASSLLDLMLDILRSEQLPEHKDEVGRVRILSPTSVRALAIPYLFVAGLSEQAFPAPPRGDRLYSESEYERLHAAGLPVVLRAERSQEEMLLFYEVITRATRRLCLSYPGLDDKAQPLLPSPYLIELEQALGREAKHFRLEDLNPISRTETPASPTDERVLAVAQAIELVESPTKAAPLATFGQLAARADGAPVAQNVIAGLDAMGSRAIRDAYGPFDGLVTSDAARALLAEKLFPADTHWSASRLEQYRGCPYKFFLQNVLTLSQLDELSLDTDALARGSRLHDILARAHLALNQSFGKPTSPVAAAAAFRKVVEESLAAENATKNTQAHQAALDEIDRRVILAWLTDYIEQHAIYDELWRDFDTVPAPAHFEVSFGQTKTTDDPLSTADPLLLGAGDKIVKLQGRIDRIDLGTIAGEPVLSVLDYKSGSLRRHTRRAIDEGDDLQVAIYALAAERLLARTGRAAWRAGYWGVADGGFKVKHALSISELAAGKALATAEWSHLRNAIETLIVQLVDAIRAGQFPVASRNDECTSYCEFSTVCRINHVRSLEKRWELPTDSP
jgi:ATP-dependent helicase/nuclease subunit B